MAKKSIKRSSWTSEMGLYNTGKKKPRKKVSAEKQKTTMPTVAIVFQYHNGADKEHVSFPIQPEGLEPEFDPKAFETRILIPEQMLRSGFCVGNEPCIPGSKTKKKRRSAKEEDDAQEAQKEDYECSVGIQVSHSLIRGKVKVRIYHGDGSREACKLQFWLRHDGRFLYLKKGESTLLDGRVGGGEPVRAFNESGSSEHIGLFKADPLSLGGPTIVVLLRVV